MSSAGIETTMNCRSFAQRIMELETFEEKAFEDRELRDHLLTCPHCEQFMRTLWSGLPKDGQSELTMSILARTSGKSCRQAGDLLCDLVDGALQGEQAELLKIHLAHCSGCSRTLEVLSALKHRLPELAELQPATGFTGQVLASLPIYQPENPGWTGRLQAWFANWAQRPRFSLEAAYLATLLMLLLFGNPFASLPETSPRLLAGIADQSGVVRVAQKGYSEVEAYARKSLDAVEMVTARIEASGQGLVRLREELSGKIVPYYEHGKSTVQSVTKFFEQKSSTLKKKLSPKSSAR